MTVVLASGAVSASDLLRFWTALAILLLTAKLLGRWARRAGQPAVVGELAAGVLLGPTLVGRIVPDATAWLFPAEGNVAAMLSAVAWLGVVLLLAVTGFEVDLTTLRRLGRTAMTTSTASLVVPIGMGLVLGTALPDVFAGESAGGTLPLFIGVALGISALPVVAAVLRELRLAKAEVGQVMLAAGMVNDVIGWALLGVVASMVGSGGSPAIGLATALTGAVLVIVGGLTVGQAGVDRLLRHVRRTDADQAGLLGVAVIIIVVAGGITQAIGVEAVLGAFVAGMILSRSPLGGRQIEKPLSQMADQVLAPVFFATAGLKVDMLAIVRPPILGWTLAIIAVAVAGKVLGGWLGARLGGFSNRDGLAVGIGLNARGALEIVVASVGLSLGVLSGEAYSAIVVMAVVTSLMAPPLLTIVLGLSDAGDGERTPSVFATMRTALMPTRGGSSSVLAGRVADAVLPPTATLTALTVHAQVEDAQAGRAAIRTLGAHVGRRLRWRDHVADDAAAEVLAESVLGYDLLALGATADQQGDGPISDVLERIISAASIPVLLVRTAPEVDPGEVAFDRVAVGVTGSDSGGIAVDVAIRLAERTGAQLSMLHIITRPEPLAVTAGAAVQVADMTPFADAEEVLAGPRQLAVDAGVTTEVLMRRSRKVAEELLEQAEAAGAGLLVIGAERRSDGSFLGHTVTHLLEHAPMSVAVAISPRR